jgi:hypothetical protein
MSKYNLQPIAYWVTASDNSGNKAESDHQTLRFPASPSSSVLIAAAAVGIAGLAALGIFLYKQIQK